MVSSLTWGLRRAGVRLWNIDNPGTPMYESAHFISSRTMSAFDSYPMPENYPDYPSHRQALAYLKGFADTYGLSDAIEFNTEVSAVEATRTDAGWSTAPTA